MKGPTTRMGLLAPIHGVWNPEDLVCLDGTPWVVASGMRSLGRPGGLFVIDRRDPARAVPLPWRDGAPTIAPHGLSARRRSDGALTCWWSIITKARR